MKSKELVIDYLYLDLTTCGRCQGSRDSLVEALALLSRVLDELGYEIKLNMINITSKELAMEHQFVSSPTIRANGKDICTEVKESDCGDCGDLCGSSIDCRVFVFDGEEYEKPPKAMIAEGILKALYGALPENKEPYVYPANLDTFFDGVQANSCCCGSDCAC